MKLYDFKQIESKWRKKLESGYINKPDNNKPKYYCLDMFPYPSAAGLHVGHWRGYVLSDVLSRYKLLQGYYLLHPMGYDAFGLPAENYAISKKTHPSIITKESIDNYRKQLKQICAIYNWDREIDTTDPNYYKWTQWIFIQMFKNDLAYEKEMLLNWCPNCSVVLANEEAASGYCERCKTPVTKKMLRQWMLRITKYAERLLEDLKTLDWPEKVKKMQSDWIGKSYGAEVKFKLDKFDDEITVFTTRPDTLYGATFMVLAPEHDLVSKITTEEYKTKMDKYVQDASTKSSVSRMADKEKTGVFTGSYAINPLTNKNIPIWISDYVLKDYGTGAIMCVPAHDDRDFEFAKKFNLPIIQVIKQEGDECLELTEAYIGDGVMTNSDKFNNMSTEDAKKAVSDYVEELNIGKKTINYKLRDWVFSRQRYWGEPIPLIHCEDCGIVPVDEKDLPVILPNIESYEPTNTGESPLANIDEWINTPCPKCGKMAKRETNTMPQWAGSSWYFLRFADPHNNDELASKEALEKFLPVDNYVGGIEHAVLHLLYARFYTKFLYDIGAVSFEEPFTKLFNQGMIVKNSVKMSKSLGNIVSPDDLIEKFGCDSLRMYELFIGPPELDSEWNDNGIDGVFRFLNKVWRLINENMNKLIKPNKELNILRNKMIFDITTRLENLTMNTVVSGFMEYTNKYSELSKKYNGIDKESLHTLIILLSPFAPNISEELWELTGNQKSVFESTWPKYDMDLISQDEVEIPIQINGKFRENFKSARDQNSEYMISKAKEILGARLDNVIIIKEIYVPNKIINFVVKNK